MPKRFLSYKDETRKKNFGIVKEDGDLTNLNGNEIQLGCILRIAESMELMCRDREDLERKVKNYGELAAEYRAEIESLKKSVAAYKGKLNKLKKELSEMEAKCI